MTYDEGTQFQYGGFTEWKYCQIHAVVCSPDFYFEPVPAIV